MSVNRIESGKNWSMRVNRARRFVTLSAARAISRTLVAFTAAMAVAHFAPAGAAAPAQLDMNAWPQGPHGVLIVSNVEKSVSGLLAKLSLEEKVGQMIQADIDSIRPEDLREYKLGSILAGADMAPGGNVRASAHDWLALTDAFGRAAVNSASRAHVPIPLLFAIDAVHGHAHVLGATIFPHNVGLGAAHDVDLVGRVGRATAEEVAATGIDWTFAPTVAVARDSRWGRAYESYSEDPSLVASYSAAMVTGLQGSWGSPDFMAPGRTMSSVKHFMGDGGTIDGRDQFDNPTPEADFARIHAAGYPPAIAAGVLAVMASYNSWRGVKMHANRQLLTDVLKERFGFNGFVVGDWNAQEEVPGCTKFDCPAVINAGIDMVMAPDSWKEFYGNTVREVRAGIIPLKRIDDAVRRILRVKFLAGLFDRSPPAERAGAEQLAALGSAAHRAIAREAVRKSLVLLKNDGGILPISPRNRVLVAGSAADNIGQQSGGWTIDWQGAYNTNADFPGATSIYRGIKAAVEAGGGRVEFSRGGRYTHRPAVAIVVFGETPYAEVQGDRETLEYSPDDKSDLRLIRRLRADRIPVVAVFLSGRPLWVNAELNAANAFVAAWLPGSEGGGIADVLIRTADDRVRYDFTGRLALSWPATVMPARMDATDRVEGALFARGYGLDYAHPTPVSRLAEASDVNSARRASGVLFTAQRASAPWSVFVGDDAGEVRLTTSRQVSPRDAVTVSLARAGLKGEWSGKGTASVRIGGRPIDLRAMSEEGRTLQIRVLVEEKPTDDVWVGVRCTPPSGAEVRGAQLSLQAWSNCKAPQDPRFSVLREMAAARVGRTTVVAIPLACFARLGADLSEVEAPFNLTTGGRARIVITDVRFGPKRQAAICPAP